MADRSSEITAIALNTDRLMRRIHAQLQLTAAAFDTHNVGPIGGMALLTIGDYERVDVQTLSQALGRDKSQVSRLLKRLEEQGLIEKEKSAHDGRTTLLTLTVEGGLQLERIREALTTIIEEILKPLSASEKEQLDNALTKVASATNE